MRPFEHQTGVERPVAKQERKLAKTVPSFDLPAYQIPTAETLPSMPAIKREKNYANERMMLNKEQSDIIRTLRLLMKNKKLIRDSDIMSLGVKGGRLVTILNDMADSISEQYAAPHETDANEKELRQFENNIRTYRTSLMTDWRDRFHKVTDEDELDTQKVLDLLGEYQQMLAFLKSPFPVSDTTQ